MKTTIFLLCVILLCHCRSTTTQKSTVNTLSKTVSVDNSRSGNGALTNEDIYTCGSYPSKDEFLRAAVHPLREDSLILAKSDTIKSMLNKLFTRYYSMHRHSVDTVILEVLPTGELQFSRLRKRGHIDQFTKKQINKRLASIKYERIPNYSVSKALLIEVFSEGENAKVGEIIDLYYTMTGGRSRESIMYIVRKNLPYLKYKYNDYLKNGNEIAGRVTVKFAVDEFGTIIFCKVYESAIKNEAFQKDVVKIVRQWRFAPLYKRGDVTEINYPFIFSR